MYWDMCSLARNKKSTCIADLNGNVLKIKESHETHLLKENGVMGAFLCEICHFQRLRRNLVPLAQRTWLGLYFRKEKENVDISGLLLSTAVYPPSLLAPSTSAEDTGGNVTLFCQDGPRDVPFACGLHGAGSWDMINSSAAVPKST